LRFLFCTRAIVTLRSGLPLVPRSRSSGSPDIGEISDGEKEGRKKRRAPKKAGGRESIPEQVRVDLRRGISEFIVSCGGVPDFFCVLADYWLEEARTRPIREAEILIRGSLNLRKVAKSLDAGNSFATMQVPNDS
jgi:hypothetical protein